MMKVLCFGELLLRFPLVGNGQWTNNAPMQVYIGGAELNVATALARWQIPVRYFTAMPDNFMAKDVMGYLTEKNIEPVIELSGERVGIYYLQEGGEIKGASTIFDRKNSSFATLKTGAVDWDKVLDNVGWFHFSAIAAAVSAEAAALCKEVLMAAAKRNITISVDLNFRSLLWKYGKAPTDVMPDLVRSCHLIMGNIWSANSLLGIPMSNQLDKSTSKAEYLEHATATAMEIFRRYPLCRWVANTFRLDAVADDITYYAALNSSDEQVVSPVFKTNAVVDKVGSGDCFMAGLIYGIGQYHSPQQVIDFAAAAAFGKLQEKGDSTSNTIAQVNAILSATNKN